MAWALPGTVRIDQQQAGGPELDGQVAQQLGQPVLPGLLPLLRSARQGVRLDTAGAPLDQSQLRHIAADRGLGRPEATLAERGHELLLGADGPLVEQVADGLLAHPLHDFHASATGSRAGLRTTAANTSR